MLDYRVMRSRETAVPFFFMFYAIFFSFSNALEHIKRKDREIGRFAHFFSELYFVSFVGVRAHPSIIYIRDSIEIYLY